MQSGLFDVTRRGAGLLVLALAAAGCENSQLLAPTKSTITLSAPTRVLPTGGTTEVTAIVVEEAGTPVANGTTVRFSTSLGRVDPVEQQTRNGVATTTFFAMSTSGVAQITAISGAASGGTDKTNVLEITIGTAAVNTVTLRANPGSVSAAGGSVELIATVVAENGRALEGISVTFSTDQGTLASPTATTDAAGQARTTLTTTQKATVAATAGAKTSSNVTVDLRVGPGVSISCTPASGSGNCSAVQAGVTNNAAAVLFTVKKASSTSALRTATIDFGDGTSQALGNLSADATVTHTYSGPSGSNNVSYTATVQATDLNGESASASTVVILTPRGTVTPINVNITATEGTKTQLSARWTFKATVTGGGEGGTGNATIRTYKWTFGDGDVVTISGDTTSHIYRRTTALDPQTERRTVEVLVTTQDGRTASTQEEIIVQYNAAAP